MGKASPYVCSVVFEDVGVLFYLSKRKTNMLFNELFKSFFDKRVKMLISRCLKGTQLNPCQPLNTDYLIVRKKRCL